MDAIANFIGYAVIAVAGVVFAVSALQCTSTSVRRWRWRRSGKAEKLASATCCGAAICCRGAITRRDTPKNDTPQN